MFYIGLSGGLFRDFDDNLNIKKEPRLISSSQYEVEICLSVTTAELEKNIRQKKTKYNSISGYVINRIPADPEIEIARNHFFCNVESRHSDKSFYSVWTRATFF